MVLFYRGQEKYFCQRFEDRELAAMHNVAGEIKGAEAAMRYAVSEGIKKLVIYHDYEGIAKWCNGAWKANKEGTKAYQAYYESVCRQVEITFVKVKGHSNDTYNDMADALAKQALGLGTATESSASALLPVESVLP
jgi:ribonuclease HI